MAVKRNVQKRKAAMLVGILAFAVLIVEVIVMIISRGSFSKPVLTVNGSPIYQEEYFMLLKEYQLQYESELYEELEVPQGQELMDHLENDMERYQKLMEEKHIETLTRLRIQQSLAETYGVLEEPFSYEDLLKKMGEENAERKQKIADGEVVYGVTEFDMVTYYSHFMSNLQEETIRAIPDEDFKVTDEAVEAYYRSQTAPAFLEGEKWNYTIYDVGILQELPEEDRAAIESAVKEELLSRNDGAVSAGEVRLHAEAVQWSNEDLRQVVRQGRAIEEQLLSLQEHEVSEMFYTGETWLLARYDGIEKVEQLGEGDKSVLRAKLREDAYWKMVEELAAEAAVKR